MFHSRGGRQFQRVEVRVGDDDPGNKYSSIKDRNTFCSSFLDKGKQMKYYNFECSKYGLKGKYITLTSSLASNQKERYDVFSAAEVELFGKLYLLSYTLNISLIMVFKKQIHLLSTRRIHILFSDCPNGFVPVNNKCFKWMTESTFVDHIRNCELINGKMLSTTFESNDPAVKLSLKLMSEHSAPKIYLGK